MAEGGDMDATINIEDFPVKDGQIDGPGTEVSDDIPAMLSDGEFVMTAKAVKGAGSFKPIATDIQQQFRTLDPTTRELFFGSGIRVLQATHRALCNKHSEPLKRLFMTSKATQSLCQNKLQDSLLSNRRLLIYPEKRLVFKTLTYLAAHLNRLNNILARKV
jgi:hypothetical protein